MQASAKLEISSMKLIKYYIRWQISAMKHLFSLYFLIEIQLYDKGKRDNLVQEIDLLFS